MVVPGSINIENQGQLETVFPLSEEFFKVSEKTAMGELQSYIEITAETVEKI